MSYKMSTITVLSIINLLGITTAKVMQDHAETDRPQGVIPTIKNMQGQRETK